MAQYKVPQDVEADDKLLGPFSFRQFVYLLVAGGCIAIAVGLFQLFPILAIIPILPAIFMMILALPLKKDQPMETYLAAIVSYYLKPRTRMWVPGQRDTMIRITAPKKAEESRVRNITGEEATHRLSFLADIVDTGGYAIKGAELSNMREELVAEAKMVEDMFEAPRFNELGGVVAKDENDHRVEVVKEMQEAIKENEDKFKMLDDNRGGENEGGEEVIEDGGGGTKTVTDTVIDVTETEDAGVRRDVEKTGEDLEEKDEKGSPKTVKPSIMELANNTDFSVATIAKEANRINGKDEEEVFISLH